jgi:UDP-3-O-[3-hydroxymyristoyl] glucosamine N-acyltransferase
MTWDERIIGVKPEDVSYNEKGVVIKDQQYYCERPRLEFVRALQAILEARYDGAFQPEHDIHETAFMDESVAIGNEGFGFERDEKGVPIRMPHFGNVVIEKNVELGSFVAIDRAVMGSTFIGENTKIDNHVHIAHGAQIGKNCLIVAGAVIGGSAEIGDNCFIGMNASIKNKIKIGKGVTIGAGAVVVKEVPDGWTVIGNPARRLEK